MRYIKQRDNHSCGPVAIMNVLKWAGHKINHQDYIRPFQKICKCAPVRHKGTYHRDFDYALRKMTNKFGGVRVRRVHKPTLPEMDVHLSSGGIIVLNYRWRRDGGNHRHFSILSSISPLRKTLVLVNDFVSGPAERKVSRNKFKAFNLRFQRTDPHYKAWFISKEEN